MSMFYTRTVNYGPSSILVLDNLNALCPVINKDAPPNLLETIKTEKFC